ncbi:MAG: phosphoribosylamine--glycine ligase [Thermoleophilia bacterium]|nr:phosphoribosylamine--glycine ligase [Thermoleophilia bacterium]
MTDDVEPPATPAPPRPAGLRVLIVGGGGRDHALASALARSPMLGELHVAPGNAGIARIATCHPVRLEDRAALVEIAQGLDLDFAIVGAEDLLVAGLASELEAAGVPCLGPSRGAARLEGSKVFAKQLMERGNIPTPDWESCTDVASAHAAIERLGGAVAVKADGLAAGMGAFVCPTPALAHAAVDALLVERRFGASGDVVVIERLVAGDEVSVMAVVDGTRVVPLPTARDYKRLGDGDAGPNTGGMGAHAPSTDIAPDDAADLACAVIQPIVDQLAADGTPFRGVVYAGVMLTPDGPQVLEYNCRFGNPETQALVRVLGADLLDLLHRAAVGSLEGIVSVPVEGAAVAVCIAAEHYPDLQLETESVRVTGLDAARAVEGVELHYGLSEPVAGTTDAIDAAGGRVITISAWSADIAVAVERAYAAAALIKLQGRHLRTDIGQPALAARVDQPVPQCLPTRV